VTRVAITTDRFRDTASGYVLAGLSPVSVPCIRFEPEPPGTIDEARSAAAEAGLLLITSPRVVSVLWPRGGMPAVETAAVGPSTAAAIIEAGGQVRVVGDSGLSRLIDAVADRLQDCQVMVARAAGSDSVAMDLLRELAPNLADHVVYRVTPTAASNVEVDAAAFASPSAVDGWCLTRSLDDVVVGAIGKTTARAIARHREPDVVATRPSHLSLARTIANFMEVPV
jgi:uroporphyrinogen-III synthase